MAIIKSEDPKIILKQLNEERKELLKERSEIIKDFHRNDDALNDNQHYRDILLEKNFCSICLEPYTDCACVYGIDYGDN